MDEVYKLPKIAFPEVTGSTVSFYSEYDGLPLKKCEVAFAATQSGTGDPSPDNVRSIIGVDNVSVVDSAADPEYYPVNKLIPIPAFQDGEGDPSPSNVRQILYGLSITRDDDSELEVYGGTLNVFSGELIVTHNLADMGDLSYSYQSQFQRFYSTSLSNVIKKEGSGWITPPLCEILKPSNDTTKNYGIGLYDNGFLYFVDWDYTTAADLKSAFTGYKLVYELATPQVIQLSSTELQRAKDALGIAKATIDLDGTRYGGTVDLVSGKLLITDHIPDLTNASFFRGNRGGGVTGYYFATSDWYSKQLPHCSIDPGGLNLAKTKEKFNYGTIENPYNHIGNFTWVYSPDSSSTVIRISLDGIETLEDFNAIKSNLQVKYPLATPIEVQLTPAQIETIQGNNTIFADTGDTTVQYIRVY